MTTQISGTTGLSRNALPFLVGQVIFTAGGVAPSGFLKCDGAAVSRSTYAALFAVCGTTFGVGNGSTTFNLPDLRGEFIRGLDDGRGVDSGRVLGSAQAAVAGSFTVSTTTLGGTGVGAPIMDSITINGRLWNDNTAAQTVDVTPGDSRPRNIALLACIFTGVN